MLYLVQGRKCRVRAIALKTKLVTRQQIVGDEINLSEADI